MNKKDICCDLGNELDLNRRVLYESDNFFIMPTIGQIGIEGYILLCSKEHFMGIGGMPEKYRSELEEVLKHTKKVISEVYNSDMIVFEHGPRVGCYRGGGCLDHTHLHIVPFASKVMETVALRFLRALGIKDYYKIECIDGFGKLGDIYEEQKASYLFVETNDQKRFTTEINFVLPSQFLRQIIAKNIGREDKWNWKDHPDYETVNKTIEQLQGKF